MIGTLRFLYVMLAVYVCVMGSSAISWALDSQADPTPMLQKQDISPAATRELQQKSDDAVASRAVKPSQARRAAGSVVTMDTILPPGFRDDDDDSSLPFLLNPVELENLGIKQERQELPKLDRRALAELAREAPIYKVRIHAIRTANDDGTDTVTISPQQIRQLVDQTNRIWWSSGVEFVFDPENDVELRNNTLLHQKFSMEEFEAINLAFAVNSWLFSRIA